MSTTSKYKAVQSFSVGGVHFDIGDVVPLGSYALQVALGHGDTFVKADTARTRKQTVDDIPATDTTEETS